MSVLAALAIGAMAAVASTPAMATLTKCPPSDKEYKDRNGQIVCATAKSHSLFQAFAACPFGAPPYEAGDGEMFACLGGESFYKEKWKSAKQREEWEGNKGEPAPGMTSYFTAGDVTVALKNSIILQGGLEETEGEFLQWIGAVGTPSISPVAQPTIPLTKGVNTSLLSESEMNRYNYYVKDAKQTKTYATVELAGAAEALKVNLGAQLSEQGTAFVFPVKVKLTNPFLGESCYVGSNEHPIDVPFTTGQSGSLHGKLGELAVEGDEELYNGHLYEEGILAVWGDTLVSTEFSSPGVEGCGVAGGADAAVDSALGLPAASGNASVLNGVLKLSGTEIDEEALHEEF